MEDDLAVARGAEAVSEGLKLGPQLPEVVDLAVVDEMDQPIVGAHRLIAVREVDDAEPSEPEACARRLEESKVVGTAVHLCPGHRLQKRTMDGPEEAGDPAHCPAVYWAPTDRPVRRDPGQTPSVRRLRFEGSKSLGQRLEDRGGDAGRIRQQRVELPMGEDEDATRRLACGGRRPGAVVDERDLPEEIARPECVDPATVPFHAHGAVDDDEELVPDAALLRQRAPGREVDLVDQAGDARDVRLAAGREERHPAQPLKLAVLLHGRSIAAPVMPGGYVP